MYVIVNLGFCLYGSINVVVVQPGLSRSRYVGFQAHTPVGLLLWYTCRLGLGAKFLPHSLGMRAAAASPVEKKLMAKLNIQSKDTTYGRAFHQQCKKYEKRRDGAEVDSDRQSDEEEMFESRASAFKRKAARQSAKSLLQYDEYKAPGRPKRRKRRKKSSR